MQACCVRNQHFLQGPHVEQCKEAIARIDDKTSSSEVTVVTEDLSMAAAKEVVALEVECTLAGGENSHCRPAGMANRVSSLRAERVNAARAKQLRGKPSLSRREHSVQHGERASRAKPAGTKPPAR